MSTNAKDPSIWRILRSFVNSIVYRRSKACFAFTIILFTLLLFLFGWSGATYSQSPVLDKNLTMSDTVLKPDVDFYSYEFFPKTFEKEFKAAAQKAWWHLGCIADTGRVLGVLRLFHNKDISWIIDIGANEGQTTEEILTIFGNIPLLYADKEIGNENQYCKNNLNPGAKVLAVEPMPENMKTIKKRAELNMWKFEHVVYEEKAVSTENGEINFFVGKNSEVGALSQNSNSEGKKITVKTVTLNKLIDENIPDKNIFLLKIDTEGHDGGIIKKGIDVFKSKIPRFLIFEYHKLWKEAGDVTLNEVSKLLYENGYVCFFVTNKRLLPISGKFWKPVYEVHQWSNIFCGHDEKEMDRFTKIYHLSYSGEYFEGTSIHTWLFE